jgi:site-specific recombinase XerD
LTEQFLRGTLENGYDIRTVQELLGHKNVETTHTDASRYGATAAPALL